MTSSVSSSHGRSYTVHLSRVRRDSASGPVPDRLHTRRAPGHPAARAHRTPPVSPVNSNTRQPRAGSYRYFTSGLLTFINRTYAYCRGSGLQVAVARRWGSGPVYTSGPALNTRHGQSLKVGRSKTSQRTRGRASAQCAWSRYVVWSTFLVQRPPRRPCTVCRVYSYTVSRGRRGRCRPPPGAAPRSRAP